VVANQQLGKEISLLADNLSTNKTKRVEQFLAAHLKLHLPLHPDLLLLAQSGRKLVCQNRARRHCRGVFTWVKDLARRLKRYIRYYNRAPKLLKWTYRDPSHRISVDTISSVTGH